MTTPAVMIPRRAPLAPIFCEDSYGMSTGRILGKKELYDASIAGQE